MVSNTEGILQIRLNRPEVKNAFNRQMISELSAVFESLVNEKNVRVVLIAGEGDIFCSGADLNWMKETLNYSYQENLDDANRLSVLFSQINNCEKPVVAKIHKYALGGGVGLVCVSDYVIAEENTQFSLSEVRLGLIPACIGPFVQDKIGDTWCRALFLSAERFNARKALKVGLVHDVISGMENLDKKALEVCNNIKNCSPTAVKVAKRFLRELKQKPDSDKLEFSGKTLADIRVTKEAVEGIKAFLEKRKPSWLL